MNNDKTGFLLKWPIPAFCGLIFISCSLLPAFILDRNLFVEFFSMKNSWYFKFFIMTATSIAAYFLVYSLSIYELMKHSWIKKVRNADKGIKEYNSWYFKILKFPLYFLYHNITNQIMLHKYKVDRKNALNYFKYSHILTSFIFLFSIEIVIMVSIQFSNWFYFLIILSLLLKSYLLPVINYGCFILFYKYINFINEEKKFKNDKDRILMRRRHREARTELYKKKIKQMDKTIDVENMTDHDLRKQLLQLKIKSLDAGQDTKNLSHLELRKIWRELNISNEKPLDFRNSKSRTPHKNSTKK